MGVIMVYKPTYNWGAHPVPYNGVSSHFRSLSCGERLDNSGCGQQNSKAGPISILPVRRLGRVQFLLQDILESHTFCYETILYIYYIYTILYIYTTYKSYYVCQLSLNFGTSWSTRQPKKNCFPGTPIQENCHKFDQKKKKDSLGSSMQTTK